ncbi:MAG: hypothetical protein K8F91_27360, partial [Candidatus Obscuribacterales bacterium]|nr:hypothetical protein [Candidatus Obscuribacterales bacterium]
QTVGDLAESLLKGMLAIEPAENASEFNRRSGRSAIEELIDIVTDEVQAVKRRLTALLKEASKKKYAAKGMDQEKLSQIDFEITGRAIGQINRLGNVGPHLVKAIEHLHKINPDALSVFIDKIAHATRLLAIPPAMPGE